MSIEIKKESNLQKKVTSIPKYTSLKKVYSTTILLIKRGKTCLYVRARRMVNAYEATAPVNLYIEALETSLVRIEH